jgi:crotonobetainyl-CoA:carnitine CoA-transferase CaiB-like acyl-CoA transferase
VLERLGLSDAVLRARNPRLIHVAITGYGQSGPLADRPCFDPIMQGRSGLSRAQGGDEPVMFGVAYTDYATATLSAVAALAALFARDRDAGSSGGQSVWTSLLGSAFAMQAGFFIDYSGKPPGMRGGACVRGTSALHRAYAARDGWLFVAAPKDDGARPLLEALGVAASADELRDVGVDGALAARFGTALAALDLASALERLGHAGIPAVPCDIFPGIVDAQHLRANDLWWRATHPDLGEIVQPGAAFELTRTPMRLGPVAPRLGEHSTEVLLECGLTPTEIDHLQANGVVRQA